jgi:AI-2 transport protein TqsA
MIDAFISCPSPWAAVGLLLFYIVLVTIEGYLIIPLVMGRSLDLNATTVLLACLYWDLVWGPAGLFLAMPLMAAARTVCIHVPDLHPWANLMGTRELRTADPPAPDSPPEDDPDATLIVTP